MDLLLICVLFAIGIYAVISFIIHRYHLFPNLVVFHGPFMALQTTHVKFFDRFMRYKKFFEIYGAVGVAAVVAVGAFITLIIFLGVKYTLEYRPSPEGVYAPKNIFMIPGVNDFIPATIAVFIGIISAIVIHEFGHAILCRVENIALKSGGILLAIIPIGAFIEPNEDEMEKASIKKRVIIYGAGITNNLVVGIIAFIIMILLVGLCVQGNGYNVVSVVTSNSPAMNAGIRPGDYITHINGESIEGASKFISKISESSPGDQLQLTVNRESLSGEHFTQVVTTTLEPRPAYATYGVPQNSGYLGMSIYNGNDMVAFSRDLLSPIGIFRLLASPIGVDAETRMIKIFIFDTYEKEIYTIPFEGFWQIIHILFWIGWMNLNIGMFNAVPIIPLDGGFIMRDGLKKLFGKTRMLPYASLISIIVSLVMIGAMASMYILPWVMR